MPKSFRQELLEAVDAVKESYVDKKLSVKDVLKITAEVCGTIESAVAGVGSNDEDFDQLVLDVEWLVQTYVVPYDIPFIGPFVERTFVDPQMVNAVRPALEAMRSQVK